MPKADIELKLADCPDQIAAIVRKTIQNVYPHYYPPGAVQFFLDLHCEAGNSYGMEYQNNERRDQHGKPYGHDKRLIGRQDHQICDTACGNRGLAAAVQCGGSGSGGAFFR